MTNSITSQGLAYASLSTHELAKLYYNNQPPVVTKLPRDFMINTLIVRQFGQAAYDSHAASLFANYGESISHIKGQLGRK